ncbi:MAG: hypothetical protein O3A96_14050 [Proteobacteria bacterium]|nr:hypothetical protein [Pseudomonadota bacterium]
MTDGGPRKPSRKPSRDRLPALRREPPLPLDPNAPRRNSGRRWLILLAGWTFIVLGVLGLVLPFLQGILFLLVGLWLLSHELEGAYRLRQKVTRRIPRRWRPLVERAEAWSDRLYARLRGD